MRVVGITGRSGCGKSSVRAWLAAQGCLCLDADALARQLLAPGAPAYGALVARLQKAFGCDIVDGAGALRRRLLADRAFATPQGTRILNEITHPPLLDDVSRRIRVAEQAGESLLFLDGAAIVGTPFRPLCDILVLVTAPYEASVQRICARDGLAPAAARRRLDAQLPEELLRREADYILPNDGTQEQLYDRTAALLARLQACAVPPPAKETL